MLDIAMHQLCYNVEKDQIGGYHCVYWTELQEHKEYCNACSWKYYDVLRD